jgi:O-antigen/teichoic acid export membrane protein
VLVTAFVGLVQEFLNLNLGTAVIRFGAVFQAQERKDKLFALVRSCIRWSVIMLVVSVAVVFLLSELSYDHFIRTPGLETYVILYAVASGFTYFNSVSRGLLRLYYRFRTTSLIEVVMDTLETVAAAVAIWFFPRDLDVFFPAIIVVRLLNGAILNIMAYAELRSEWESEKDTPAGLIREERGEIRDFVVGNSVGNTLKTMISQGDVLLLGLLTSPEQVAYYAVAKKLAYSVLTLTDPLVSSIYPQLSKLVAERRFTEMRLMLRKITSFAALPALAVLGLMYFINARLVTAIYGLEFAPASASFMFFLTGALLAAVTFWTLPLVQSLGLVRMRIVAYVVTIVFGVTLSMFLLPYYQAAGMAIALMITNILNAAVFMRFAFREIHHIERQEPVTG